MTADPTPSNFELGYYKKQTLKESVLRANQQKLFLAKEVVPKYVIAQRERLRLQNKISSVEDANDTNQRKSRTLIRQLTKSTKKSVSSKKSIASGSKRDESQADAAELASFIDEDLELSPELRPTKVNLAYLTSRYFTDQSPSCVFIPSPLLLFKMMDLSWGFWL